MLSKGQALKRGDTVGLIATSQAANPERFELGLKYLENQGLRIKVALQPTKHYGDTKYLFSSDSIQSRKMALEELFSNKEVKAIIAVRGAYGAIELLPSLNYSLIKRHPKPFVGFSDSSALLLALYHKAKIVTVHGPSLESFARAPGNKDVSYSAKFLFQSLEGEPAKRGCFSKLKRLSGKGDAKGPIICSNLSVLAALVGTPYLPNFDGHILCFEEIGEKPYRLHRMLLQMKLAGRLNKLKGVVVGCLRDCVHAQGLGPTVLEVIANIFSDFKYPVLYGANFGHQDLNLSIPLGIKARIYGNELELHEVPVLN